MTADTGFVDFTATRAGCLPFLNDQPGKAKAGSTRDQGQDGADGPAGPPGPAGESSMM
jgi:hypothetical protein